MLKLLTYNSIAAENFNCENSPIKNCINRNNLKCFGSQQTKHQTVYVYGQGRSVYTFFFWGNYLLVNDRTFRARWSWPSQSAFTCSSSFTKQQSVYRETHTYCTQRFRLRSNLRDARNEQTVAMTMSYNVVLSDIQLV